jgi:hypothetical protein
MDRSAAAFDEHEERHSDRPTIPASADLLLAHGADQETTTKVDASAMLSGATVRTRASDFRALLEAERRLADTARSGVRALAPEVAAHKGASVAPAALAPSPPTSPEPLPVAFPPPVHAGLSPPEITEALPAVAPAAPPRAPADRRRFVAGILFTLVMGGALGLLGVGLSRKGLLHLPQPSALHR